MNSGVTDLIDSFSTSELRDLAVALSSRSGGTILPPQRADKQALLALLRKSKDSADLAIFAHRIEAITPIQAPVCIFARRHKTLSS